MSNQIQLKNLQSSKQIIELKLNQQAMPLSPGIREIVDAQLIVRIGWILLGIHKAPDQHQQPAERHRNQNFD
jgi:hypothetical protein